MDLLRQIMSNKSQVTTTSNLKETLIYSRAAIKEMLGYPDFNKPNETDGGTMGIEALKRIDVVLANKPTDVPFEQQAEETARLKNGIRKILSLCENCTSSDDLRSELRKLLNNETSNFGPCAPCEWDIRDKELTTFRDKIEQQNKTIEELREFIGKKINQYVEEGAETYVKMMSLRTEIETLKRDKERLEFILAYGEAWWLPQMTTPINDQKRAQLYNRDSIDTAMKADPRTTIS